MKTAEKNIRYEHEDPQHLGYEHHKESKNTKFRENLACLLEYYFVSTYDELQPSKLLAGRLATHRLAGFKLTNLLACNAIDSNS